MAGLLPPVIMGVAEAGRGLDAGMLVVFGIEKLGILPGVLTPVTLALLPGAVSGVGVCAALDVTLEMLAG